MDANKSRALKIIDAHAHIFPQKIAEKATKSIGSFYGIEMMHGGTSELLLESGSRIGVSKYLVCSSATKPEQVEMINDFISGQCSRNDCFFGFGTMHPAYHDIKGELARMHRLGLHGVKLHPDFQSFNIDDLDILPMYRAIQDAGFPILFHTGDQRREYSAPHRLRNIAVRFPELVCIGAHFGGYSQWSEAAMTLQGLPNVYFDTSSTLFALSPDRAVGLIHHFGAERFMFGTDFPMWDHEGELDRFLKLNLTAREQDLILHDNFISLFSPLF